MAIVRNLRRISLERDSRHFEVDCTYTVVTDESGKKWLQIDTYGSKERKMPDKKSQSVRCSPEAISQLKNLLNTGF